MMQRTMIKCPGCGEMVWELNCWFTVDNLYFHVCKDCEKKSFSTGSLLKIGFYHGYEEAKQDMRNWLSEQRAESGRKE